jgi:hypothetical protein
MGERQYESVRRPFTDIELVAMHEQLVVEVGNVKELRGQKTQTNTTINAAIKTAEKSVWDLQEKLALGYEQIDVEVIAIFDRPEPGKKLIVRVDTNQELRVEPMTLRERQQAFGFTEERE